MGVTDARAGDRSACMVAIIGAGYMADEHIRAFADVPGVTIAGIFSRTPAKAEGLARTNGIKVVARSVAELFERTRADLVVVAVSELAMREVAIESFEFPWTVLLEKPPGHTLREARTIQHEAQIRKRKVLVALNRRCYSTTRVALEDLAKRPGARYIHVQDQQSREQVRALGFPEEVIDSLMYVNSIHLVDYLRLFGRGEVKSVNPIMRWNPSCPGVVLATLEFESGDLGLYEAVWQGPGPWAVSVTTPEIRWELRPLEKAVYQVRDERRLQGAEASALDQRFKPGLRLQAADAAAAASGRRSGSVTLDDALKTMELVAAIYGSD